MFSLLIAKTRAKAKELAKIVDGRVLDLGVNSVLKNQYIETKLTPFIDSLLYQDSPGSRADAQIPKAIRRNLLDENEWLNHRWFVEVDLDFQETLYYMKQRVIGVLQPLSSINHIGHTRMRSQRPDNSIEQIEFNKSAGLIKGEKKNHPYTVFGSVVGIEGITPLCQNGQGLDISYTHTLSDREGNPMRMETISIQKFYKNVILLNSSL